ncbi:MAG: D-alanine--D-alanine ligase, partial [Verrucomicrobiota bacterium]
MKIPKICILYGGIGPERSVSLESGQAVIEALQDELEFFAHDLTEAEVPSFIKAEETVVFPVLHGRFGEDGELQAQLEDLGIEFCGCNAASSELCIDKVRTKNIASSIGAIVAESLVFDASEMPSFTECLQRLGDSFVIKPSN